MTRLDALKAAVTSFTQEIAKADAGDTKIALVQFAADKGGTSGSTVYQGTEIRLGLTPASEAASRIQEWLSPLACGGPTRTDRGLEEAERALAGSTAAEKMVVLFTDGVPNDGHGFQPWVADRAIAAAGRLKQAGAKVHVVSLAMPGTEGRESLPSYEKAAEDTAGDANFYYVSSSVFDGSRDIMRKEG